MLAVIVLEPTSPMGIWPYRIVFTVSVLLLSDLFWQVHRLWSQTSLYLLLKKNVVCCLNDLLCA